MPNQQQDPGMDEQCRAKLSVKLKEFRDEAIKGRAESGIETIWTEDREYYDGIDDANRAERQIKPATVDGVVTRQRKPKRASRSSVFLNITARYVNAAAAYVADKLIRSDVSNYGMRPTPIPSLIKQTEDLSPATDETGQSIEMPVMGEQGPEMRPHVVNGQPMMDQATGQPVMLPATKPATKADMAKQVMEQAKKAAEAAKGQIDDWLNESGGNREARKVIGDSALIGTGVMKGPFPEMVKSSAVLNDGNGFQVKIEEKLIPKCRRISAWNIYPDPSCGTDIHRGKYIFEDDEINSRLLGELKNDPTYIREAIDKVLEEGPKHAITGTSRRKRTWSRGQNENYQIWYFHGYLSADDLDSCGYQFDEEPGEEPGLIGTEYEGEATRVEDGQADTEDIPSGELQAETPKAERKEQYPCIVVMVNETIIKATVSPFDSGRFPYHVMCWQARDDHWTGIGVARQMRTSQDGVNAGARMLHDNAGVAGAPILIIDRSMIVPADGNWTVGPHKVYYTADDFSGDRNIREAFTWIITPMLQVEMMNIIQFWMKAAEEETGMPMLLQGQQGDIEMTRGEAQMLSNNGSALLRRVTNTYDDDVTKPLIGAYYEWLLIHGEDDSMKGDFTIDAIGSSVLIERDLHGQLLGQMLGASLNPAYGADPELVYKEWLISQRFDAERLMLTEEKKAELAKRQPPVDPRIETANINAQVRMKEIEAENTRTGTSLALDKEIADLDRELAKAQMKIDATLQAAKLDGDRYVSAEETKAEIAQTFAKLKTQIALSKGRMNSVIAAPSEPAGRAQPGRSYEQ